MKDTSTVEGGDVGIPRRDFMKSAASAAAISVIPHTFLIGASRKKKSANSKLNIAAVGIGGMGKNNIKACETENIVALCDIDDEYAGPIFAKYPKAKKYTDYRTMLEKEKRIDAVIIATPDHTHAPIAMEAIRAGKHVYVQKPLSHSVNEARAMTEEARKHKVMTQMGNQGHSGEGTRQICEWIWSGAIGEVREIHAWTNRPVWPQSIEVDRPADTPPVPATLDWDRWIGPAPMRPYHPDYLPQKWRAWWDFGTGSLGDLGCHILDPAFWALKLKYPVSVEACISAYWHAFWKKTTPKNENYPRSSIVRYKFPEREGLPALNLTWYDGGMMPPRPEELEDGRPMGDSDGGLLFVGDKGKLMTGCYGLNPKLIPETRMAEFKAPAPSIPRIPGDSDGHEQDWIRACKTGTPACSNFDYSGPLSEMVLMGNLAVRFPERKLLWDGEKMEVTNNAEANTYVRRVYREGWTL
ncbi:MAG: Gfo/Idh/MocA family oxidoreductase [Candidatus Hydrogenedentes bacterium]|nr:Gfo/Idh/MocA family oxidoreductase [Candidatus Hydrogenedentota bacterium]